MYISYKTAGFIVGVVSSTIGFLIANMYYDRKTIKMQDKIIEGYSECAEMLEDELGAVLARMNPAYASIKWNNKDTEH